MLTPSGFDDQPTRDHAPAIMVVTADNDLIEALLRLAAATDTPLAVMSSVAEVRGHWARVPLAFIGVDQLDALIAADLPRRTGVHVVQVVSPDSPEPSADASMWQRAVELGVETVAVLPADERQLLDRLVDTVEGQAAPTPVVAFIGGCGGAGASILAVGLAHLLAAQVPGGALLIDADPLGGGIDLRCEAERVPGLRWPELLATRGRVSPQALRDAVPTMDGTSIVSHDRTPASVSAATLDSVIAAGPRGFGVTVIDVGRGLLLAGGSGPDAHSARAALARAHLTVVVVPGELQAVAASRSLLHLIRESMGEAGLVVRQRKHSDLESSEVAAALALPILGEVQDSRKSSTEQALWSIGRSLGVVSRRGSRRRVA